MTDVIGAADREAIETIVTSLEAAWNAGDGEGFGAPFTQDADFVTIRAEHMRGRDAIAAGHAGIFLTIYAGSINHYTVESIRLVRADVALVHVRSALEAPSGPMAGRHDARFSMVFTREMGGWQIASFHNTLAPAGGAH